MLCELTPLQNHVRTREWWCLRQSVLADVSIATGYATIALMLAGRLVFQYLGWGVAAMTTPLVMAVTGGAFFAFSLFGAAETATYGVYAGAITQAQPGQPDVIYIYRYFVGCTRARSRRQSPASLM